MVHDKRWSYEGMLPYFRKCETHHDPKNVDMDQHGTSGPIHTTASARPYPLRDLMRQSFLNTGLKWNPDANSGNPLGVAAYTENWRDGKRQPAGLAYGLKGVEVKTSSTVRRIILEDGVAKGAELADGTKILANKEVILSCGAIRSPQMLLLSGIGPKDELQKHGIQQLIDSPEVGSNFNDHFSIAQFYKVKNADKGLAMGHPNFKEPIYFQGVPGDMVATAPAPKDKLKAAMIKDGVKNINDSHPLLAPTRGHIECLPLYAPAESPLTGINVPLTGEYIMVGTLNLLPTSRGSVRLASTDPSADPLIDPNYYATEADRVVMREGMRLAMRAMESPDGQAMVESEFPPKDMPTLTSKSTDEEIDARVRRVAATWFHPTGSCSMGTVIDTDLRVNGAKNLRVVDASIMPCPIGAHYQVATYAIAEQAADIITAAHK